MTVFVITGVCQPGEDLSLVLPRFLQHPSDQVLLWIDFKNAADFARVAARVGSSPGIVLRSAPAAIWGGASVVLSMMAAIAFCQSEFSGWDQLVFCSLRDVPLMARQDMTACLARDWSFDYCGSRWGTSTSDLLKPLSGVPVFLGAGTDTRSYQRYQIRPDMSLQVETALSHIYTPAAVDSLRLCQDVFERYLVAAVEFPPLHTLTIQRLSPARAGQRHAFFTRYGLSAGRQWCVLSRRFCDLLLSPPVIDLVPMFHDVVIPDECFFQTVAAHYAASNQVTVKWDNLYYGDAHVMNVNQATLRQLVQSRSHKLFARKADSSITSEYLHTVLSPTR